MAMLICTISVGKLTEYDIMNVPITLNKFIVKTKITGLIVDLRMI